MHPYSPVHTHDPPLPRTAMRTMCRRTVYMREPPPTDRMHTHTHMRTPGGFSDDTPPHDHIPAEPRMQYAHTHANSGRLLRRHPAAHPRPDKDPNADNSRSRVIDQHLHDAPPTASVPLRARSTTLEHALPLTTTVAHALHESLN